MPTDADWGRLYKFDTTGDAGLVMPFRSYYFREFFPGGWTQLAIGMIYRNAGSMGDLSNVEDERQNEITPANLFHFGLSKPNNGVIDVANNPNFIGLRGIIGGVTQIDADALQLSNLQLTAVNNGATEISGGNQLMPLKEGNPTDPFAILGLKLTKNPDDNRIYIRYAWDDAVDLVDDADNQTQLTAFLANIDGAIGSANGALTFSNLLNISAFFIYWPYLKNRLFLQTVGAIKYA